MPSPRRKLAVVCGKAPVPNESFIRRDLDAISNDFDIRIFGLNSRGFSTRGIEVLANYPLRRAISVARRLQTANQIASFTGRDGIILAHFAWTTADIASAAAKIAGCKWICFVHAWDVFTRPKREIFSRLESASLVIACSRSAAEAVTLSGIEQSRIVIVHHGIKFEAFREFERHPSNTSCIERPLSGLNLTIRAVGRLVPKKGFDTLVRAWPEVRNTFPQAVLEIVGDGPCRSNLEKLAASTNLPPDAISFAGMQEEHETLRSIAEADAIILPSRRMPNGDRDGIANVIIEAMALKTPVITTNSGAAGEIIVDGETGLLVPDQAMPDKFASAITRLFSSPTLREAIINRAYNVAREEFDISVTSTQLKSALNSVR